MEALEETLSVLGEEFLHPSLRSCAGVPGPGQDCRLASNQGTHPTHTRRPPLSLTIRCSKWFTSRFSTRSGWLDWPLLSLSSNSREPFDFISFGLIKTLVVLLWLALGIRLILLVLDWMTQQPDRFNLVQPDTKPLFDIGARVILVGGAIYFVLISWNVDVTAWLASAGIHWYSGGLCCQGHSGQPVCGRLYPGRRSLQDW